MILTVKERLLLLNVLPREGDITTLRVVRQLREALSFSEEEHATLNFVTEGNELKWSPEASQEAEIALGKKASDVVAEVLKKLSDNKTLHEDYVSLWDKFNPET